MLYLTTATVKVHTLHTLALTPVRQFLTMMLKPITSESFLARAAMRTNSVGTELAYWSYLWLNCYINRYL